jgi:hypothetical protein
MAKANALMFPSSDALLVALTCGMVPGEVQATPVRYARGKSGVLALVPDARIPKDVLRALGAAGVELRALDAPLGQARCWGEVLEPRRISESQIDMQLVLFNLEGNEPLMQLAGELLRLGCDRQAYAIQPNGAGLRALLRAAEPPYYTVASALDRGRHFTAFVPVRPAQEVVFVELGFTHPLAQTIQAPPGEIVLIPKHGPWLTLKNGPWSDVYQLIDFQLPESGTAHDPIPPPRRLTVPLRFSRGSRSEPASLWVVGKDPIDTVDRLVQTLPDDVAARLSFAVSAGDATGPVVILRARAGRSGPPEIDVAGEAYVPLLKIANLFLPRDRIIEPPLRRDKLRELLAPRDDEIGWLAPVGEQSFRVESIPDSAFRPLLEWVEYLVESGAEKLRPWVDSALFDFDPFVSIGVEWAEQPKAPEPKDKKPPREKERRAPKESYEPTEDLDFDEDTDPTGPMPPAQERREEVLAPVEQDVLTPDEERLAELEQRFLELEEPLDSPARTTMWAQMARLSGRLNRQRDAGLCWAYALWEQGGEAASGLAREWAEVDTGEKSADRMLEIVQSSLQASKPSRGDVRDVVAVVVSAHLAQVPDPSRLPDIHDIQNWLDQYDDVLDVRSLWLARHALAELVGGDRLAMARARDRILTRLRVGLSLERDVPNFLRFLGGGAGGGRASELLAGKLEELLEHYAKTARKRKPTEAKEELTGAYVRLVLAYGFARLGRSDRARALRDEARRALDLADPIHGFLTEAFSARIDHALEGRPVETPLPTEIAGRLNALAKFDRYKVDRLREVSTILEPQENLDPIRAYQRGEKDPRGAEFEKLRGMTDDEELAREVSKLMDVAVKASPEERDRLFDGLMDFFPLIPSQAKRLLERVAESIHAIEPGRRAIILQEALMLAGYFGLSILVRELAGRLRALLSELDKKQAVAVAAELGKSLRSLRRVGLVQEAAGLLEAIEVSGDAPEEIVARVQVAGGLMYLGDLDRAKPAMAEAHEFLARSDTNMDPRLQVHHAAATAWSHAPEAHAVANLEKLSKHLKTVTDSYGTNSHFCRSVIQFMEALVLGYASEHLALGELGRRWMDEDEYLIRRRIHRALGA